MCIIIDANMSGQFAQRSPESEPIWQWAERRDGKIAIGGTKLAAEYERAGILRLVTELGSAGIAVSFPGVDEEALSVETHCSSDDEHIVALARVSGARVVFTADSALTNDIKNKQLIDGPRGKVYRDQQHRHLLRHSSSCPF